MTKLPRDVSSKQVIKALKKLGFVAAPYTGGSHQTYIKKVEERTVPVTVVLGKKSIPVGTLQSIIRQAGCTKDEFMKVLNDSPACS